MKTSKESPCWGEVKLDSRTWVEKWGKDGILSANTGGRSLTAAT